MQSEENENFEGLTWPKETLSGYHLCNVCRKELKLLKRDFAKEMKLHKEDDGSTISYDGAAWNARNVVCNECLRKYKKEDLHDEIVLGQPGTWWHIPDSNNHSMRIDNFYTQNRILLREYFFIMDRCSTTAGEPPNIESASVFNRLDDKPLYTDNDLHILFAKYHKVYLQFEDKNDYDSEVKIIAEIVTDFERRFECKFDDISPTNHSNYLLPDFDNRDIYLHYLNMKYSR